MRTNLFTGCLLAGLTLAVPSLSLAQSRVTGRVLDTMGRPVAGAEVKAQSQKSTTSTSGRFELLLVDETPDTVKPQDQPVVWVTTVAGQKTSPEEAVQWVALDAPAPALETTVVAQERSSKKSDGKKSIKRDIKAIAGAMKILDERGYTAESARLREIMDELVSSLTPKTFDERAAALLEGDIQDRAVRVGILELCAEGYDAAGWESAAEAMHWFAGIGRAQVNGEVPNMGEIPAGARGDDGNIMDRMVELVLGAAGVHQSQGNSKAADACMALGRFYVMRELGAFNEIRRTSMNEADPYSPEVIEEEPAWDVGADEVFEDVAATDAFQGGRRRVTLVAPGGERVMGVDAIAGSERLRGLGYAGGPVEVTTEETHPRPEAEEARAALETERRNVLEAELEAVRTELQRVREQLEKRRVEIEAAQNEARRSGGGRIRRR